jgi:hypothetical protein
MALQNPVADMSQNVLTMPEKVIAVDLNGNAMSTVPAAASADAVAATSMQEMALGAYNGATIDRVRIISKFVQVKAQAVTAGTPVDVYTPTTGKKFRILGYHLSVSAAAAVIFDDGSATSNEVLRTGVMATNTSTSIPSLGMGVLSAAANTHLYIDTSASATVNGWIGVCDE